MSGGLPVIAPSDAPRRSWKNRIVGTVVFLMILPAVILGVAWAYGQIVRDSSVWNAYCFFIPSKIACLSTFLAAIIVAALLPGTCSAAKRWRYGFASGLGTLSLLALIAVAHENHQYFVAKPEHPRNTLRIVHWNVAARLPLEEVRKQLVDLKADLYFLSECNPNKSRTQLMDALGPEYRIRVYANMVVIGKGQLTPGAMFLDKDLVRVWPLEWWPENSPLDRPMRLLFVDFPSDIRQRRQPWLAAMKQGLNDQHSDLVIGDMNSPRRSWELASLPDGYQHAYDRAGHGGGDTWPSPIFVYAIDQCIIADSLPVIDYEVHQGPISDHAYQILTLAAAPPPP